MRQALINSKYCIAYEEERLISLLAKEMGENFQKLAEIHGAACGAICISEAWALHIRSGLSLA
ncbi:MAG: hypothetical protein J0M35_03395 [Candidatus Obscuribacter phosphatis]|uniref:Uncharacterized protein n=1 Tax=Candidatus Obscuribacter phosphatis TaxID=1906157 RepID=A0A8J7TLV1_9BACT|nr:hypothetical protein [Candidatus Obscuribacter phosphatis]